MSAAKGTVYLVGAGPGDPGLITVRGLGLVQTCDVVLYDRLVSPLLLDEAPAGAERIFVGKHPGDVHSRQVIADALLVSKAKEGKSVVRLKGGDPFVFGRGGEEAALLREASVPFEIVPGVSSAIAAPAYAGIPVTHRGASASFVVLTAREEGEQDASAAPLTIEAETIVLMMGVAGLDQIASRLIAGGRDPNEPAAAIEWAATSRQRVVEATLSTIGREALAAKLEAPATTVIGQVVALRSSLRWFEERPLLGVRVAVTRARDESRVLSSRLTDLGAEVIALPLIEIEELDDNGAIDAAIHGLTHDTYQWVVFASAHAVDAVMTRVRSAGLDARAFAGARVAAVGKQTARALERHGLTSDLVPKQFTADELADELGAGSGRVLFPRVADAPKAAADALKAHGWVVDDVASYRNVPGTPEAAAIEAVKAGDVDLVTFTSASTANNFAAVVGDLSEMDPRPRAVAIGPATADAARNAGFEVVAVADPHDTDGLVQAVLSAASKTGTM